MSQNRNNVKSTNSKLGEVLIAYARGMFGNDPVNVVDGEVIEFNQSNRSLRLKIEGEGKMLFQGKLIKGDDFEKGDEIRFTVKNNEIVSLEKA